MSDIEKANILKGLKLALAAVSDMPLVPGCQAIVRAHIEAIMREYQ